MTEMMLHYTNPQYHQDTQNSDIELHDSDQRVLLVACIVSRDGFLVII